MMSEEEYQTKIRTMNQNVKDLEAQQHKLFDAIRKIKEQKEELKIQYDLEKIRNGGDGQESPDRFEWSDDVITLLRDRFQFSNFRGKQLAAINATMSKKDVILVMSSGGGKTLVYLIPALIEKGITVIIAPAMSLIEDQLMALAKLGIPAATLNDSSTNEEKRQIFTRMIEYSNLKLLFVTPQWVYKNKTFQAQLQKCFEKGLLMRFVIEEIHCCSSNSHDFRPPCQQLGTYKELFPEVPWLGLTATASVDMLTEIQHILKMRDSIVLVSSFNRPNLFYKVVSKCQDRSVSANYIAKLLKEDYKDQSGIIYTSTTIESEVLTAMLKDWGLSVSQYHGQVELELKKTIHQQWVNGTLQALVATGAFALGIDKPDVRFVIHHVAPKSMEALYQESGRAGRDGDNADCIVMFNLPDVLIHISLAKSKKEEQKILCLLKYAVEHRICRRTLFREYFEETQRLQPIDCYQMCDNCRKDTITDFMITSSHLDIVKLVEAAKAKKFDLNLEDLIGAWYQTTTFKELEGVTVNKPTYTRELAIHIVGYLISKGYLGVSRGFSVYSDMTYLRVGKPIAQGTVLTMPYEIELARPKEPADPNMPMTNLRKLMEPPLKKIRE